jgi:bifunctional non-homologous end joining protein LigD
MERMIAKRPRGRVYMDWVQVGRGKTVVMPFTVRARPHAPVSMPLTWQDVHKMTRSKQMETASYFAQWNITNVPKILARNGDPWKTK